ncbi:PepSY domain-containing protein [Shinella zoogloeoides]|uniref:PepSY domain-containing protein n=1 Tax=Shinella zoogloeoides TaxID=352475 RepID=UPI001968BF0E|nr:PepSY domain-containing protein [Shinella zoogloeoides]
MTGTNTFALTFALMLGTALPALADQPGADWMPLEEVVGKLKAAGYTAIHQIEADDGRWEGEGMKNGTRMEFSADPRTGAILTEHPDN